MGRVAEPGDLSDPVYSTRNEFKKLILKFI
jgi:hypothetical protein